VRESHACSTTPRFASRPCAQLSALHDNGSPPRRQPSVRTCNYEPGTPMCARRALPATVVCALLAAAVALSSTHVRQIEKDFPVCSKRQDVMRATTDDCIRYVCVLAVEMLRVSSVACVGERC
jgi:hypothetical protein